MWNSLNILYHKISLIFIDHFLLLSEKRCVRLHQLFRSVALQNKRMSGLFSQHTEWSASIHRRVNRIFAYVAMCEHRICMQSAEKLNVWKEQTFRQKVTVLLAGLHQQSAFSLRWNVLKRSQSNLTPEFVLVSSPSRGAWSVFCLCIEH
jgi:hypothetical protein